MSKVTDEAVDQRSATADPEGTLRAELLGRLIAAQGGIEAALEDLKRAGTASDTDADTVARCASQLAAILSLRDGLSSTPASALPGLRASVAATVSATHSVAQSARASAVNIETAALLASAASTRNEVEALQVDLFGRRIFDPFLRFASREDEEAYRRREEENRRYIEQQLAAKTPEGDLNAAGATMVQMLDAHARGAGDSPEFAARWNRLVDTTRRHREAVRADGRSTEEFDRNLKASVQRYLREKGLPDVEIEARLAVAGDPLDAVRPHLTTEREANALDESIKRAQWRSAATPLIAMAVAVPLTKDEPGAGSSALEVRASTATGLDDVMAQFRAGGVVPAPDAGGTYAHGVKGQILSASVEGGPDGKTGRKL